MEKDIVIKKSKISGKGIFAQRDFKKGEVVLKWDPKSITKEEFEKLPNKKLSYVLHIEKKYFLMQAPEKFVNYSCESNTFTKNLSDIANRDITTGEEITSNYGKEGLDISECNCGSKKCKGKIIRNIK